MIKSCGPDSHNATFEPMTEMGHKRPRNHVSADGSFRQLRKSDHGHASGRCNLPCKLRLSPPLMKMLWKATGDRHCKSLKWTKKMAFAGAILAVPSLLGSPGIGLPDHGHRPRS
jgi:hypothetical protein